MTPTTICILTPSLEDPSPYMLAARSLWPGCEVSTKRASGSRVLIQVPEHHPLCCSSRGGYPCNCSPEQKNIWTEKASCAVGTSILVRVAEDAAAQGKPVPRGAVRARVA